jgi:hypothetical protein
MKQLLLSKPGKIAIGVMIISILLVIISRVVLLLLRGTALNHNAEIIFSTCLDVIYSSILLFTASVITLIITAVIQWRKARHQP